MSRTPYAEFSKTARHAITALSKSAVVVGLDKSISELVKLPVPQIIGYALCIAAELKDLLGLSVPQPELDFLVVRHKVEGFSDVERVALGWAEEMTAGTAEESREALAAQCQSRENRGSEHLHGGDHPLEPLGGGVQIHPRRSRWMSRGGVLAGLLAAALLPTFRR